MHETGRRAIILTFPCMETHPTGLPEPLEPFPAPKTDNEKRICPPGGPGPPAGRPLGALGPGPMVPGPGGLGPGPWALVPWSRALGPGPLVPGPWALGPGPMAPRPWAHPDAAISWLFLLRASHIGIILAPGQPYRGYSFPWPAISGLFLPRASHIGVIHPPGHSYRGYSPPDPACWLLIRFPYGRVPTVLCLARFVTGDKVTVAARPHQKVHKSYK